MIADHKEFKVGDKIIIVLGLGMEHNGKIVSITPEELVIEWIDDPEEDDTTFKMVNGRWNNGDFNVVMLEGNI